MDLSLKALYPNIEIPPSLLSSDPPPQQGLFVPFTGKLDDAAPLGIINHAVSGSVNDGMYFGRGGVNYSTPIGDGQLNLHARPRNVGIIYQRNF